MSRLVITRWYIVATMPSMIAETNVYMPFATCVGLKRNLLPHEHPIKGAPLDQRALRVVPSQESLKMSTETSSLAIGAVMVTELLVGDSSLALFCFAPFLAMINVDFII
jgi:hypothetical protein